jgi:hypothetical protein
MRSLLLSALLLSCAVTSASAQSSAPAEVSYHAARGSDGRDESRISVAGREAGPYAVELNWRCTGDSAYYLYLSGTPLTDDSLLAAQWRFDGDAPQEGSWRVTPRHAWATSAVNEFTNRALNARAVRIVLTNSGGSRFTSSYSLQGLREAMSRLACLRGLAAAVPGASRPPPR